MQQMCTNCGAFTRRSIHHEEEYQNSVLLKRLRTSNFPATEQEITHIRHDVLLSVSDDLSSINSKIASLHQVIRSMEEERERLMNVRKKYSDLISLQRALPSEIWSTVFLHTFSVPADSNAFDVSGSMWRLSHVCQKWRNVALSLQSFWSTIDIHFPRAVQREADVQRLEAVVQRSHQGLLDISLSVDAQIPGHNPLLLKRVLDVALAESYRWQKLHVVDWPGSLNTLYASLPHRFPCLESVRLDCHTIELEGHKPVATFKDCPRLRKLVFGGSQGSPPAVEVPWGQVTELDLSRMDLDGNEEERRACMRMIGLCPSLETLSVPYWYLEESEDESPYIPTTCLNVRKLSATSLRVVDVLTLPRLREVSLRPDPAIHRHDALYSVERLLIRSNALTALTSLSLSSVPIAPSPDRTLHSLLSQTYNLTSLHLVMFMQKFDNQTDASDREEIVTIVQSLKVVPEKGVTFLPLLSSLHIQIYNHPDAWQLPYFGPIKGGFASMLKARWRGDGMVGLASLRSCHFGVQARYLQHTIYRDGDFVPSIFNEAERLSFNALVDEGMNLTIRITSTLVTNIGGKGVVFAVP